MQELTNFIRAGYSCIQIVTAEEERAISIITSVAKKDLYNKKNERGYNLWTWTVTKGLRNENGTLIGQDNEEQQKSKDPVVAMSYLMNGNITTRSIIILKDFHMFLKTANPMLIRLLKEAVAWGRQTNRHIIIVGCQLNMQPELEKEIQAMDLPLPSRAELEQVVESISKSAKQELNGEKEAVLDAMVGLTTNEAADAASYSVSTCKKLDPKVINKIKTDTIRRNGMVELVDTDVSMDDIGGLDRYKQHVVSISGTFTKEAREWGLPQPQSIIAVGNPGTGKSMSSMALKTVFGLPLLRLEASRLFNMYVGESERNWRTAFATAKAIAPCILWMDEAEGLFAGSSSGSAKTDSGVGNRIVKAVLQDMQMNSEGVFFIFTSNDIDGFPDPLIDRCDVWAFDLPSRKERESIWSIHIKKRKRKPKDYDLASLSDKSEGFSGRQIEQAWVKAMTIGWNDGKRDPATADVEEILKQIVPTSVTMKTQIERRRERLKNRAQSAS